MQRLCVWCNIPAETDQHIFHRSLLPPGETRNRKEIILKKRICNYHNNLLSTLEAGFGETALIKPFRIFYVGKSRKKRNILYYDSGGFRFYQDNKGLLRIELMPSAKSSLKESKVEINFEGKREDTRLISRFLMKVCYEITAKTRGRSYIMVDDSQTIRDYVLDDRGDYRPFAIAFLEHPTGFVDVKFQDLYFSLPESADKICVTLFFLKLYHLVFITTFAIIEFPFFKHFISDLMEKGKYPFSNLKFFEEVPSHQIGTPVNQSIQFRFGQLKVMRNLLHTFSSDV